MIYQSPSNLVTTQQIKGLEILDNTLGSEDTTPRARDWDAVRLCAVKGAKIGRNRIRNTQRVAVALSADAQENLDIEDVDVDDNYIDNVGIHSSGAVPRSILIFNALTSRKIKNVRVRGNMMRRDTLGTMRGILVQGPGTIEDVDVDNTNSGHNLAAIVETADTGNFTNVRIPSDFSEMTP